MSAFVLFGRTRLHKLLLQGQPNGLSCVVDTERHMQAHGAIQLARDIGVIINAEATDLWDIIDFTRGNYTDQGTYAVDDLLLVINLILDGDTHRHGLTR